MLTFLALLAMSGTTPPAAPPNDYDSLSLTAELAAAELALPQQEPAVRRNEAGKSPFSYSFVEFTATSYDVEEFDEKADQYAIRGSLGLFDFLYLFAGYENQSTDFGNTDTDMSRLGAGVHFNIVHNFDLVGDVAWLFSHMSSDLDELDDSNNGYEVHAGGRWMPIEWNGGGLEAHGGLVYINLDNRIGSDDQATGWEAGAKLHFLRMFSVGGVYTMLEDDDSIGVNARVSF